MSAKDLVLRPISSREANAAIKRLHYSGKVVNNSQIHIGVFWNGSLEGALQFGPPLDKRKIGGLVRGSQWHNFCELNRMAFSEALPRNSESRAIGVAFRLLRANAPQLKWVVSFADATQCGDGTIYRASGFLLTGIKRNNQIWAAPSGETVSRTTITAQGGKGGEGQRRAGGAIVSRTTMTKGKHVLADGAASMKDLEAAGWRPLPGYQFRYIRFLDPTWRDRLAVPVIPFDKIPAETRMYRGEKMRQPEGEPGDQSGTGGASPTLPLHSAKAGR